MGRFTVYSKDGQTVRCVLDKLEYTGVFMAERACTSTFISDAKINFDVFDYIDYRGERFELELLPTVKKISKHQYSYDLNFVSLKYELERCMMRNIVPSDNGIVYPTPLVVEFTGTVKYLAERIQACLDAMYGKGVWSITLADGVDSEEKNISMSNQNCWSALSLVNTEYKLNYFVKGRSVTIGGAEPVVNNVFEYGKGKGLYEIERISDADTGIVTKLRAYGGTRNLDYSYPKKPEWTDSILPANYALSPLRLMLPSFKTDGVTDFVLASNEAIAKYGIREGVITYDDIYPSITGMKNSAGQAIDEIKSVDAITSETQPTFTVQLYDLGFDLNESLMPETQLSMKSGALQGYAFAIAKIVKASDGSYTLTLGRNTLEEADTDNFTVPNKDWNMKAGDKFVLLNILMPQEYIRAAENRLLERAKEYLAKYSSTNYSYNIGVDEIFMARNANFYNEIMEGKRLTVNDPEMGIDHENVIIQSLSIKEGEGLIPTFEVTLNNEPSASTLERIQGQISEIETSVNNKFSSQSELSKQYRKKLDKVVWDRNLEERTDANGVDYLFLSKPIVTAAGITMYSDDDTIVPSIFEGMPIDPNTLQWVDGRLTVIGGGSGGGSVNGIILNGTTYSPNEETKLITLPNYPTTLPASDVYSWAKQPNKPSYSFSELSSHPTTLGGYGITDAYTKSDADGKYVLKAGDTMTGKLLFNANSSIDLVYIPRTKSAISFNNAGSNRIGINFTDGDGNLRIAKTDINQDWVSGDVNILLGSNKYKVLHAGNYNSYAPTLTGGGASGNWNINVTGYSNGLNIAGYGSNSLTYFQTDEEFAGLSATWRHYIICNHGNGETYFNRIIALDFFNDRISTSRMQNGTREPWKALMFVDEFVPVTIDTRSEGTGYPLTLYGYSSECSIQYTCDRGVRYVAGAYPDKWFIWRENWGVIAAFDQSGIHCSQGWLRTYGNEGWYSQSHGGGITMNDDSCVEIYGNKNFKISGSKYLLIEGAASDYYAVIRTYNYAITGTDPDREWCFYHSKSGVTRGLSLWSYDGNGTVFNEVATFASYGGNRLLVYGNIIATGGMTMYGSDETKKDILGSFILPIDYISNAPLWRYTWKDKRNERVNIGGSAQYTKLMMEELVGESKKGLVMDYATTAYAFSVSLAKHLSDLILNMGSQEGRLARLERENEELKERVMELERRAA